MMLQFPLQERIQLIVNQWTSEELRRKQLWNWIVLRSGHKRYDNLHARRFLQSFSQGTKFSSGEDKEKPRREDTLDPPPITGKDLQLLLDTNGMTVHSGTAIGFVVQDNVD